MVECDDLKRLQGTRRGRIIIGTLWSLLVLGLVLAFWAGVLAYLATKSSPESVSKADRVRVEIPKGSKGKDVARILVEKGLIKHEFMFRLALKWDQSGGAIKYGRYDISKNASLSDILTLLKEGPNVPLTSDEIPEELKLRVPEGLTIAQMATLFDEPQAFLEVVSDQNLIQKLGIDAKTLEGFLFPSTYFFDKKPTPRDAVEKMVEEFERRYLSLTAELVTPEGFDKLKLVTIASLIEEETKVDSERPLVAAVIYNRLKQKMTLDLDSTLQYALKKYGQRLLDADKQIDSEYNTYRRQGLPPTPICNPGLASLRAAFSPADVEYLYFVSNADGRTHTFSKTLAEHNRAVARFRRLIAPQRLEAERQTSGDPPEVQ